MMDISKTIALSKQFCAEEADLRIRIADDVVNKTFLFSLPWDMESTVEPVTFTDEIDWDYMPGEDCEWTVMLSRHRYTVCLAQAYALTGQQRYLDAFVDIITSFIVNAPLEGSEETYTWRTIDSGIRCSNWIWALHILEEVTELPALFLLLIRESLGKHIQYLVDSYDATLFMSNWGVLANSGALTACFYLQNNGCGDYESQIQILLERLEEEIQVQVLPDGWQWEQSPMYHHEVLWCYLEDILLLRENQREASPIILEKTKSMCYATLYFTKPNHHQWMRCDSDDTDVRDILTLGAFLFSDGHLKYGAYEKLDFDNLWRLGGDLDEVYQQISAITPDRQSVAMETSGNYVMRTSWQEDASMLAFKCGHLGSGHGHADLLHMDLFAHGEDVLIDSGRYTYVNGKDRLDFKSQLAHNTITIDHKPFTECPASWRFGRVAKPIKGSVYDDPHYYYVSGSHLGYIQDGLFLRRQIVVIKPDIFILCDSLYGSGQHECTQKFHFNNIGTLSLVSDHTAAYHSTHNQVQLTALNHASRLSVLPSRISHSYNTMETASCVEISQSVEADCAMITVITIGDAHQATIEKIPVRKPREDRFADDICAQAARITYGEHRYVIIFSINDPIGGINLLEADGERGFGEVMVFDQNHHRSVLSY